MTTVSQIITDAYRESNLIAISEIPNAAQEAEALRFLDRGVKSVFGYEVGENLIPFPLGRNNIQAPTAYPIYDNLPSGEWFTPVNTRFILNLTQAVSVPLHPSPGDGTRDAVVDASDNLSTYNVTLQGNGRTIEGSSTLTLNTDGLNREWFYRQDLGEWKQLTDLSLADEFPFPSQFDDMFIVMLAMRLNPRNNIQADQQTFIAYTRSRKQFRARYKQTTEVESEAALLHLSRQTYTDTDWRGYSETTERFKRGYTW